MNQAKMNSAVEDESSTIPITTTSTQEGGILDPMLTHRDSNSKDNDDYGSGSNGDDSNKEEMTDSLSSTTGTTSESEACDNTNEDEHHQARHQDDEEEREEGKEEEKGGIANNNNNNKKTTAKKSDTSSSMAKISKMEAKSISTLTTTAKATTAKATTAKATTAKAKATTVKATTAPLGPGAIAIHGPGLSEPAPPTLQRSSKRPGLSEPAPPSSSFSSSSTSNGQARIRQPEQPSCRNGPLLRGPHSEPLESSWPTPQQQQQQQQPDEQVALDVETVSSFGTEDFNSFALSSEQGRHHDHHMSNIHHHHYHHGSGEPVILVAVPVKDNESSPDRNNGSSSSSSSNTNTHPPPILAHAKVAWSQRFIVLVFFLVFVLVAGGVVTCIVLVTRGSDSSGSGSSGGGSSSGGSGSSSNDQDMGFCNWGNDGTGASSVCEGGAMGGEYCNQGLIRCQEDCGGQWCVPCDDDDGWCKSEKQRPTPPSVPKQANNTSLGFCNWGSDGTAASSMCLGGAQGSEWCNESANNCEGACEGRWCLPEGYTLAPTPAPMPRQAGFCNWGPDGTAASSTCANTDTGSDWCNEGQENCETHCSGRWCVDD